MSAAFGVHFGCTSACIAVYKDEKTEVIANAAGDRDTPAIVAFTDMDQTVGLAAKQGLIRNAANTVCNVKQLLGLALDDPVVAEVTSRSPVRITKKDGKPAYEVTYKEKSAYFTAEEIAIFIFKTMKEIAIGATHEENGNHDVVLTVPLAFNDDRRKALRTAAMKAGFKVLRIINEPTAAVLGYDVGLKDTNEDLHIVVFRMGGMSLDVTVIEAINGMFQIAAHKSNPDIGGHKMTEVLSNHFATEFKRQSREDCRENKRSMMKLKNGAEHCKHILSTLQTARCSVESLYDGIDFNGNISRARFESLCSGLVQAALQTVTQALQQAGLQASSVQKVIMCGGSSKVPLLQKMLTDHFADAEVCSSLAPDEVIALGAAKQASYLQGYNNTELDRNFKDTQVPCLAAALMVQVSESDSMKFDTVLLKGTPIPVRRTRKFQLGESQTSICLCLYSGTSEQPTKVGQLVLRELEAGCEVTAIFHIKSDGSVHVQCSDLSGKSEDLMLECS